MKMDKLSRDSTAAIKAGMSYGKWKAMQAPVKIEPPKPKGTRFECQFCGIEFYRTDKRKAKYCSYECRGMAQRNPVPVEPMEEQVEIPKQLLRECIMCGNEFVAESYRNKYCGRDCAYLAHKIRMNKRNAKLKEERHGTD